MFRSGRGLRLLALVVLLFILYVATKQYLFECFLRRRYITFDDFPRAYSRALQTSTADGTPLNYDYNTFPPAANASTLIPPTIHFIWFRDLYAHQLERPDHPSHIPHEGSDAPRLCIEHNPSFTVNVWNATAARQLLEDHYSWFLPTYDNYHYPIQRVDAFKYFVMYHYGGVYMDMDIACRRPLTPLLQTPGWFPKAEPFGVNNDLFAARQGHGLMQMMIERLESRNWNLIFPYVTIFWSTGPQFASDMVRRWYNKGWAKRYNAGESKQDSDADAFYVLPPDFYSEKYTFFGHSPGGTWHGDDVAVVLWLVDRPWVLLLLAAATTIPFMVVALRMRRLRRETFKV
ncbi:hypothetical protein PRZ48_004288 [Zasmidium cellare]|uniref:Glycosyltransferase family 32 protein n=1 Tax=Zasmidium cellare TaxID=395010 RepID=A0ABR0EQ93_ZASCE|nr:hypothetical protein PRZ48_004288 [Zasmidium cellare]